MGFRFPYGGNYMKNNLELNEINISKLPGVNIDIYDGYLKQTGKGIYIYYKFDKKLGKREFYIGKAEKQSIEKRAKQIHKNSIHENFTYEDFDKTITISLTKEKQRYISLLELILIKSISKELNNIEVYNVKNFISKKQLEINDTNPGFYQDIIKVLTLLGYDLFKNIKINLVEKNHTFSNGLKATIIYNEEEEDSIVVLKKNSFVRKLDESFNFESFYKHGSHMQLSYVIKQLEMKNKLREYNEEYYQVIENIDFPSINAVSAFVSTSNTNAKTYWKK